MPHVPWATSRLPGRMPHTEAKATAAKTAPKKVQAKDNVNLAKDAPPRGKAATNDFITNVATSSGLQLGEVKKCIDGLRITVSRQLREHKKCRIPTIASLKLKLTPARKESTRTIFGVEKTLRARPEAQKIIVAPLKELKAGLE